MGKDPAVAQQTNVKPLAEDCIALAATTAEPHSFGNECDGVPSPPVVPARDDVVAHEVLIANTGETYPCSAAQTLLSGMEALGRRGVPIGCRGGGCGVCKVVVELGAVSIQKMSRAHITDEERMDGVVLACRACPSGHVVVRAVDRLARVLERRRPPALANFLEAARGAASTAEVHPT